MQEPQDTHRLLSSRVYMETFNS